MRRRHFLSFIRGIVRGTDSLRKRCTQHMKIHGKAIEISC
jgi:hypothetical protein